MVKVKPLIQTVTHFQENGKMVLDNALKVHIPTLLLQLVKMEINQLQKFILDLGSKTKNVVLVNKIILVSDTTTVTGRMEKKMEKVL